MLSACALPGDAAPVVKIGVIAPFEGAGRPLGYAVLPAIKAAVAEANASGKLGRYQVMVVAFNDDLHGPTAAAQAQALALDPEVLGVVGPWTAEIAAAAEPILAEAGSAGATSAEQLDYHRRVRSGGMRRWLTLRPLPMPTHACAVGRAGCRHPANGRPTVAAWRLLQRARVRAAACAQSVNHRRRLDRRAPARKQPLEANGLGRDFTRLPHDGFIDT